MLVFVASSACSIEPTDRLLSVPLEPHSAYDLQGDGPWLYWWDRQAPSAIRRIARSGGTVEIVAEIPSLRTFVVEDDRLVASTHLSGFWTVDVGASPPSAPQRIDALPNQGSPIQLHDGVLVVCVDGHVGSWVPGEPLRQLVALPTSAPRPASSRPEGSGAPCVTVGLTTDPDGPLYTVNGQPHRLDLAAGAPAPVPATPLAPYRLVAADEAAWYLEDLDVFRLPKGSRAEPERIVTAATSTLRLDFAVDATHLYWLQPSVDDFGTGNRLVEPGLMRVAKTGGAVEQVVALESPGSLFVDDTAVCWIDSAGSLGCRAK